MSCQPCSALIYNCTTGHQLKPVYLKVTTICKLKVLLKRICCIFLARATLAGCQGTICKQDKGLMASHQRAGHFLREIHHSCLWASYPQDCIDASWRHNIYWPHQLHLILGLVHITCWLSWTMTNMATSKHILLAGLVSAASAIDVVGKEERQAWLDLWFVLERHHCQPAWLGESTLAGCP